MDAALLETTDARVDAGGVPAIDGLSLRTNAERVLFLGAPRALFEAACGMRPASRGAVLVLGAPAPAALRSARLAGAALDVPLPPRWTARRYVTWSARLAGRDARLAGALAADAIARLKLDAMADAPLDRVPPAARRATGIAAALSTGARVVVFEDPTAGLADAGAHAFARIVVEALADRAWAAFAPRAALASPIALAAEEALVVRGSRVAAQGRPAEIAARPHSYALTVHGPVEDLARAVEARGATVGRAGARLTVDLGEALTTRDVLAIAIDTRAVVLEMSPLAEAIE